jgi:tetratricopeptide (TPR) repeat protein
MLLAAGVLLAATGVARAQCPDGTPPPCRGAPRALVARPANMPLDDHTWIVLPFENQARAVDLDWLRDASANLLYMDLSRWSDVRAIDDKRVADYLRTVPAARSGARLTLADGFEVARRAGAGKLVMGEFLKVGSLTRVTATAYDTRTGSRIRVATEQTPVADSLMSVFGKLARGLLDVPPPSGAGVGSGGTASVAALQEYLAGVKALNNFDLAGAKPHFDRALQLDSTFAMAHYKYSIMLGWDQPGIPGVLAHAEAAVRHSAGLPVRERTLIQGHLAFNRQQYERACESYRALVRTDSTDVEALYGLGDCLFHDAEAEPVGADSTRWRFRGDWNASMRAFLRVLTLDPGYHLAFQHPLDMLSTESRGGCRRRARDGACDDPMATAVRRAGDTLVFAPLSARNDASAITAQLEEARRTSTRRRNLDQARRIAEDWVSANPAEPRAHYALAHVLLLLGDGTAADAELRRVGATARLTLLEQSRIVIDRAELALKLGRGAEVVAVLDSFFTIEGTRTLPQLQFNIARVVTGRTAVFDSLFAEAIRRNRGPPAVIAYNLQLARVVLGASPDSAVALERAMTALVSANPACTASCITSAMAPTLTYAMRAKRAVWPPFDTGAVDRRLAPARALSRGGWSTARSPTRRSPAAWAAARSCWAPWCRACSCCAATSRPRPARATRRGPRTGVSSTSSAGRSRSSGRSWTACGRRMRGREGRRAHGACATAARQLTP